MSPERNGVSAGYRKESLTVKAVEAWESGRNIPSGAADKILRVMQKHPSVIGMMQSV